METGPQRNYQCGQPGCDRNVRTSGLCSAHYQRKRYGSDMDRPITRYKVEGGAAGVGSCGVAGCARGATTRGLCQMHYARFRKHGDPLVLSKRGKKPIARDLPDETSPTKLARILGVARQRAHQLLNKTAHNARGAVAAALSSGRLIKPRSCERCQKRTKDLEAHHWDYREPLDVRWLCPPCHSIIHPHGPTVHGKSNQPQVFVGSD